MGSGLELAAGCLLSNDEKNGPKKKIKMKRERERDRKKKGSFTRKLKLLGEETNWLSAVDRRLDSVGDGGEAKRSREELDWTGIQISGCQSVNCSPFPE